MLANEALSELKRGRSLNCVTPAGVRFQVQPKVSGGLLWVRTRPVKPGCLNRYSRLSDDELRRWLESVTIERGDNERTPTKPVEYKHQIVQVTRVREAVGAYCLDCQRVIADECQTCWHWRKSQKMHEQGTGHKTIMYALA